MLPSTTASHARPHSVIIQQQLHFCMEGLSVVASWHDAIPAHFKPLLGLQAPYQKRNKERKKAEGEKKQQ